MASASAVLLLLSAGLFTVTDGLGEDCKSYFTRDNVYRSSLTCRFLEHCCGNCDHRYCCSSTYSRLSDDMQDMCTIFYRISREGPAGTDSTPLPDMLHSSKTSIGVTLSIVGAVVFVIFFFICCCCCPGCCIYQTCVKPRPVDETHVTTVMNTQSIQQQPVMQGGQYPQYQPVPTQAGYGGQPMQTAPYQGQSYAPEPPPSYDMATSPGYPTIQGAYNGGQAMYPMKSPDQPGAAPVLSETLNQPVYNPDYMQPPKTGY
ncbi:protein shisa-5 isoform X6 [Carassius gibelio]|uniref:protein shisa-5 isoform X4 n=1 Tax=Carassius gibelio TaxID=101364 RepID=UPI00227972A1|nr:protein shisa-5 isoform X4 [Carassius gibelio]XP_052394948.1 protein shisa-5 isoform X6 [Carassius gibelio]